LNGASAPGSRDDDALSGRNNYKAISLGGKLAVTWGWLPHIDSIDSSYIN